MLAISMDRQNTRRWRRWHWVAALLGFTSVSLLAAKITVDWPSFLDDVPNVVQCVAKGNKGAVVSAHVYGLWSNFSDWIDPQNLWCVEVSPNLLAALVKECEVKELVSAAKVPEAFWRQRPFWWHPPNGNSARYFMSSGFRVDGHGPDGSTYIMAYSEIDSKLYVWHKCSWY